MTFLDLLAEKHFTVYRLNKEFGFPLTTLHDISSGKTSLLNCNGKTLLELSRALSISIEELLMLEQEDRSVMPSFLVDSINALRKAVRSESSLIDCCYDELASSINVAEIEHLITHEVANILRKRYFAYD